MKFRKTATLSAKGTFLSLLLTTCAAFTACNDETENLSFANGLKLSFGVNQPDTRAIFTDATLPDASPVGVKLDGYSYTGLTYTGTTTGGKQTWAPNQDVVLTDVTGTLYAYWPYSEAIDMTAIPVDMTAEDQTDWLYATPVEGINEENSSVDVVMNHAAANINVTINKGAYKGAGAISNITIQSDAFATGGTFNAAQAEPAFTAYEGEGEPLSRNVDITTGFATDVMVVPNGTSAAITFSATIDGVQFTATSAAVSLESGNSYQYTLNLSDINTYMNVDGFSVAPWTSVVKDNLTMEKEQASSAPVINSAGKANGVYVVTADGELVDKSTTDPTAIGVALISVNQRILIEKNVNTDIIKAAYEADGATNTEYRKFYWGPSVDVLDVANKSSAPKYYYKGKDDTAAIIATPDTDSYTTYANMGTYCTKFNEMNGIYNDWYIPSAGQLYDILIRGTEINTALTNIGGTALNSSSYWSSSEHSTSQGWYVVNSNGYSINNTSKLDSRDVRFVRDID